MDPDFDIRAEVTRQAASNLASQLETSIREMLDLHAPGWTKDNIASRLRWQTYAKAPGVETLLLDGQPILELQPPTSEDRFDKKTNSYVTTFKRDVWKAAR